MADANTDTGDTGPPWQTKNARPDSMMHDAQAGEKTKHDLVLRAEFTTSEKKGAFNAYPNVRNLVETILNTKAEILVANKNNNNTIKTMDEFPREQDEFATFFPTSQRQQNRREQQKVVIELSLTSSQTLAELKRSSPELIQYLKENDTWLAEHNFATLDVESIGWYRGRSPELTDKKQFHQDIKNSLTEAKQTQMAALAQDNIIDTQQVQPTPDFEIVYRKVKHSCKDAKGQKQRVETIAYEVRCETQNKQEMCSLMMEARFDDERKGFFIPYSLATTEASSYGEQIVQQNALLAQIKKISIFGLHDAALDSIITSTTHTLRETLLNCTLATTEEDEEDMLLGIESTKHTTDKGKHFFLCKKENYSRVITWLDQNLTNYYQQTEEYETVQNAFPRNAEPTHNGHRTADWISYTTALKKSTSTSADSASNRAFRPANTRSKNVQIVFDTDIQFPPLPAENHRKQSSPNKSTPSNSARSPVRATTKTPPSSGGKQAKNTPRFSDKDTYATRTVATTPSASSQIDSDDNSSDQLACMMERQEQTDAKLVSMSEEIAELRQTTLSNFDALADTILKAGLTTSKNIETISKNIETTSKKTEALTKATDEKFQQMAMQFDQLMKKLEQGQDNRNEVTTTVASTPTKSKRIQASSPSHPDSTHHENKRHARQQPPTGEVTVPTILDNIFNPTALHERLTDENQEDDQNMQDTQDNHSSANDNTSDEESSTKSEGSEANVMHTEPTGSQES
jgi:hypothetical protein